MRRYSLLILESTTLWFVYTDYFRWCGAETEKAQIERPVGERIRRGART